MKHEQKKINPYKISWIDKIPYHIKTYIIKFWFAGAVYYFAGWGIYSEHLDQIDSILIVGAILGLVLDLLVNPILKFMQTDKMEANKFLLFKKRKFYTTFITVIYCILITTVIAYTYHFINYVLLVQIFSLPDKIYLGAEPFTFGILFLLYDYLVLLIINLFRRAK